ncbi:BspA family leucine-rich repeat surface protein, partial [Lentilactobacillus sp. Marseille-Q4993]|uniref:BspA family leucine-rich repeat surface protein n=1 Tax=Lentilactobacillus sp. Marseille-Q4993 TaxID=3039492 RepID=UPI0024BCEB30
MVDFVKSCDKKFWHIWCQSAKYWLLAGLSLIVFWLAGGQLIVNADAASQSATTQQVDAPAKKIIAIGMNGTARWELDDQMTLDVTTNGQPTAQLGVNSDANQWKSWGDLNTSIVQKVNIEKGVTLPANSAGMFENFWNATSINGLENINTSAVKDFSYMFFNDVSLTNLNVSKWDVSNATNLAGMFSHCSSLTNLDVSNYDVSKCTNFHEMFSYCTSLTSLDLSKWNVGKGIDFGNMFDSASGLKSLDLSKWNVSSGTDFSVMFADCKNLANLDVSNWNVSKGTKFANMFSGCFALTSLDLSQWDMHNNTNSTSMFTMMFAKKLNLWKLTLGPNVYFVQPANTKVLEAVPAYGTPIPDFPTHEVGPSSDALAPRWQAVDTSKGGSEFNPKGDLYDASQLVTLYAKGNANHPTKPETYVWQNAPLPPVSVDYTFVPVDQNGNLITSGQTFKGNGKEGDTIDVPQVDGWSPTIKQVTIPKGGGDIRVTYIENPVVKPTSPATSSDSTNSYSPNSQATLMPPTTLPEVEKNNEPNNNNEPKRGRNILPKGEVVYALKHIYLYQNVNFKKSDRVASYTKKPRIYRPMFVVTGYARSQNNVLRYKVRDVNHDSKTAGKTGYITANWNYVRPVYYQAKHKKLTVINPRGVNAYKNKNLTNKVKNYKQGTVLPVVNFVTHNLTTRYVLKNGQY